MPNVALPDGRTLTLTGNETPEQLAALRQKMAEMYGQPQAPQPAQPNQAAIEMQAQNPLGRMAGRAGRNIASGLGGLADVSLLIPKTLASGGELALESLGMEGSKPEQFLQKVRTVPTMQKTAQNLIDKPTSGALKPIGAMESATDFLSEIAVPGSVYGKVGALRQPKKATDALKFVLGGADNIGPQAFSKKVKILGAEDLRKAAGRAYKTSEELGGTLKADTVDNFLDTAKKDILPKDAKSAAMSKGNLIESILDDAKRIYGGDDLTLIEAQGLDEFLGEAVDNFVDPLTGKLKKEGQKIYRIQDALRETIEGATEVDIIGSKEGFSALKEGRELWARSRRMADVERIIQKAKQMDQSANAIKSQFRTLYNNPKRLNGFTKEERKLIKKIADGNNLDEALRGLSSRLFGIGSGVAGGPAGYVSGKATEVASRGFREKMALKQAEGLRNLIGGGTKNTLQGYATRPLQYGTIGAGGSALSQMGQDR